MKRPGGLVTVTLLLLVFALVEIRAAFAQTERSAVTYTDGSRYEGEVRNGKRHGRGVYVWSDGTRYEGDWRDGHKHGQGTYTWANGHRYAGEFRNDRRTGQGTYTWPDGGRYQGQFLNGKLHGRGTRDWANGERYVGEYRDDVRTGQGTYTWPNGHRYEGQWLSNKMHGQGTYTWPNGERYAGAYRDGRRTGQGTYAWPDGGRFVGEWRDDKKNGRGTRTWPDGRRYEGQWQSDRMHGRGMMIRADGSRYEGEWRNGRRSDHLAQERQRATAEARQRREQQRQAQVRPRPTRNRERPSRQDIREAQELLSRLGYAPGPFDGVWGARSIRAYRAFLSDQGRPVSSTLTPRALLAMRKLVERNVKAAVETRERQRKAQRQAQERQRQKAAADTRRPAQARGSQRQAQVSDYWRAIERRRQQEQRQAQVTTSQANRGQEHQGQTQQERNRSAQERNKQPNQGESGHSETEDAQAVHSCADATRRGETLLGKIRDRDAPGISETHCKAANVARIDLWMALHCVNDPGADELLIRSIKRRMESAQEVVRVSLKNFYAFRIASGGPCWCWTEECKDFADTLPVQDCTRLMMNDDPVAAGAAGCDGFFPTWPRKAAEIRDEHSCPSWTPEQQAASVALKEYRQSIMESCIASRTYWTQSRIESVLAEERRLIGTRNALASAYVDCANELQRRLRAAGASAGPDARPFTHVPLTPELTQARLGNTGGSCMTLSEAAIREYLAQHPRCRRNPDYRPGGPNDEWLCKRGRGGNR